MGGGRREEGGCEREGEEEREGGEERQTEINRIERESTTHT